MFKRGFQKGNFATLKRQFNKKNNAECLRNTLLLKMENQFYKTWRFIWAMSPVFYTEWVVLV